MGEAELAMAEHRTAEGCRAERKQSMERAGRERAACTELKGAWRDRYAMKEGDM